VANASVASLRTRASSSAGENGFSM
jgi:hypothetical protein